MISKRFLYSRTFTYSCKSSAIFARSQFVRSFRWGEKFKKGYMIYLYASLWLPNFKELAERHQEWSLRLNLTQHGKSHQARTPEELTDWELFLDSVGGGAWPFLVGGVICLVNSDNERDSVLLNSWIVLRAIQILLRGTGCRLAARDWAITGLWCP